MKTVDMKKGHWWNKTHGYRDGSEMERKYELMCNDQKTGIVLESRSGGGGYKSCTCNVKYAPDGTDIAINLEEHLEFSGTLTRAKKELIRMIPKWIQDIKALVDVFEQGILTEEYRLTSDLKIMELATYPINAPPEPSSLEDTIDFLTGRKEFEQLANEIGVIEAMKIIEKREQQKNQKVKEQLKKLLFKKTEGSKDENDLQPVGSPSSSKKE